MKQMHPLAVSFENLPKGFPRRIAFVPGWAGVFLVPRYIIRIDIDNPGRAGTHGWQVRYDKPTKFFSDSAGHKLRSPTESLEESVEYLALIYQGPKNRCRTTPTKRKTGKIHEAGLRLVERQSRGRTFVEIYVEAVPPNPRHTPPKRFFVGTRHRDGTGTATQERLETAIQLARETRRKFVIAHNRNKPIWMR